MRWIDMATFFWGLFFLGVEKIPVGGQAVIEGVLMLTPTPERLRLATTIDLDSGRAMTAREDR